MRPIDAEMLKEELSEAIKDAPLYIQATVDQYIDEAPTRNSTNEWVSVEDRLPEGEKCVITDGMLVAIDSGKGARRRALRGFITHWMPLPGLPERETSGGNT